MVAVVAAARSDCGRGLDPGGPASERPATEFGRRAMAYEATHRHAQISARKVRPLADLVRGKLADDALDILKYQPQRGRGCWRR